MKAVGAQHQKGHVHHGRQQPHQVAQLEKLVARQPIHACMHICMCVYACVQACVQARAKLPVAPRIVARTASSNTCIGARMTPPTTQCAAHSTKREAAHLTSGKGLLIAMLQSQRENHSVGGRGDQTCFLFFPSPFSGKGNKLWPRGAFGAGEVTAGCAPQPGVVKPPTHCHGKRRHVLEWCVIPTTTAHHLSGPSTLWTPCGDIESRAVRRAPHCRGT